MVNAIIKTKHNQIIFIVAKKMKITNGRAMLIVEGNN
jgi:hypothetical protein